MAKAGGAPPPAPAPAPPAPAPAAPPAPAPKPEEKKEEKKADAPPPPPPPPPPKPGEKKEEKKEEKKDAPHSGALPMCQPPLDATTKLPICKAPDAPPKPAAMQLSNSYNSFYQQQYPYQQQYA